jgi:type 1 fimbria pilin
MDKTEIFLYLLFLLHFSDFQIIVSGQTILIKISLNYHLARDIIWSRIIMKHLHAVFLIIGIAIYTTQCYADCTINNGIKPLPISITIPSYFFNSDKYPVNSQIGSEIIGDNITLMTCTGDDSNITTVSYNRIFRLQKKIGATFPVINGRNIYPTSNPAIGYSVGLEPTNACAGTGTVWATGTYWLTTVCDDRTYWAGNYTYTGRFHIALYKLQRTVQATNIQVPASTNDINFYYTVSTWTPLQSSTVTIQTATCSLQSASLSSITLPLTYSNNFGNIGTALNSTPFNITINCPNPTNLNITFTDNNNPSNTSNVLSALSTSTTKGLGVQLKYNDKIISFGPDSPDPGTTNQIVLNSNLTGTQTFPFTAAYVRTGTVTPGKLTARATFTLSYQ